MIISITWPHTPDLALFGEEAPKWDDPNREAYYTHLSRIGNCHYFAFVACTQSWTDYKKIEYKEDGWVVNPLKHLLFDPGDIPLAYMKQATKQQLSFNEEKRQEPEVIVVQQKVDNEIRFPSTWEELLFQIGQCIRTKSSTDIDMFLEGVNQWQNQIPADLEKQLKPYAKQLCNKPWDSDIMGY